LRGFIALTVSGDKKRGDFFVDDLKKIRVVKVGICQTNFQQTAEATDDEELINPWSGRVSNRTELIRQTQYNQQSQQDEHISNPRPAKEWKTLCICIGI
jgi:hypothetical protein